MSSKKSRIGAIALGAIAAVVVGIGADAPPQTVDAGGLTFQVPATWKASKPSNSMRRAQLKIDAVKGDEEPAELVVTAFPGGAGGLDANLKRWQAWFKDENDQTAKIETKKVKGKNVEVVRVEAAGRYVAPVFPGSPEAHNKPHYRLLGAMVSADGTSYFIRLIGPEKTMVAARPAFDEALTTFKSGD